MVTWEVAGAIEAEVSVSNSGAGHLLPTGATAAVVLLEVVAVSNGGSRLEASTGPRLPPSAGERSGRPGWLYALTPDGDTRIEPFATHRSHYVFAAATPECTTIVARLELCRPAADGNLQCRTISAAGWR